MFKLCRAKIVNIIQTTATCHVIFSLLGTCESARGVKSGAVGTLLFRIVYDMEVTLWERNVDIVLVERVVYAFHDCAVVGRLG